MLIGLDLARTLPRIDMYKELWLLSVFACGCVVCSAAYRLQMGHRTKVIPVLALAASITYSICAVLKVW